MHLMASILLREQDHLESTPSGGRSLHYVGERFPHPEDDSALALAVAVPCLSVDASERARSMGCEDGSARRVLKSADKKDVPVSSCLVRIELPLAEARIRAVFALALR